MRISFVLLLALAACGTSEEPSGGRPDSRLKPSGPPPEERRPLKEGFTQRPPRDTPGLPPPTKPLFTEIEVEELEARNAASAPADRERARTDLLRLMEEFEKSGDASTVGSRAIESAKTGWIRYRTAEALFREFLFPNDEKTVAERYEGEVVLLLGAVAPHNMVDLADGFKLVEQTPYVHEPVLLATEYELSFVRCHLARPEIQKLRDWQEVHLLGIVEGKIRGDLVLRRCIVID